MLTELNRIGQAIQAAASIGACFGIPFGLLWLVLKFTDRNEVRKDHRDVIADAFGDVPAVPDPAHNERMFNRNGE